MIDIPRTCRAAVVVGFNQPVQIREVKVPERLEHGALLVRVDVASVCGTDVHLWEGELEAHTPVPLPTILGHEMTGTVVAMGEGTSNDSVAQPLAIGDRIIWTHASCGSCYYCRVLRQPTLCSRRKPYMRLSCEEYPYLVGGFAEYCYVFPASGRVKVPDEVKSEWASPASCALRSVVQGFERIGRIEPHETLVIQGAGPLGLYATAMANHAGVNRIIVIGAPAERLALARKWGAHYMVSIEQEPDAALRLRQVLDLTDGVGPDVVLELSGARTAFQEGLQMIRRGGRYAVIGQLSGQQSTVQAGLITSKHLSIFGSLSGEVAQYWKALQFVKATRHKFDFDALISNRYGLDQINEALLSMQGFREIKPLILPHAR